MFEQGEVRSFADNGVYSGNKISSVTMPESLEYIGDNCFENCDALKKLIESGEKYDRVITIGPLIMMKFVCQLTKEYNIPTVASMNPIMIDGTGMCGGCRLTVGGETKFACVDGPEFDGHLIDFNEAMSRGAMYKPFERKSHEETCNLFKQEEK